MDCRLVSQRKLVAIFFDVSSVADVLAGRSSTVGYLDCFFLQPTTIAPARLIQAGPRPWRIGAGELAVWNLNTSNRMGVREEGRDVREEGEL
jgi:hypothetical protein